MGSAPGLETLLPVLARPATFLGVEMNIVEAAKWYLIAQEGGVEDDVLEKIVAKMSKADKTKAQQAAEAWREKSQIQ